MKLYYIFYTCRFDGYKNIGEARLTDLPTENLFVIIEMCCGINY